MDAGNIEGALIMKDMATQVIARVEASLAGLTQALAGTQKQTEQTGDAISGKLLKTMKDAGGALSTAGMKMSFGLTLPLLGAAATVTKFSSGFETDMTRIETLSGVAGDAVNEMRGQILQLGGETATGPQDLAKGLLVVTSTGLKGAEAMEVLKLAAKGSAIGLGETKDIARALTSIMTAYGMKTEDASKAMDMLYQTAVEGGAEANELAGTLGRVVGIAAQVGVQFNEVGAFIATFTRLGVDASEATTSLRAVMGNVLAPTQEASKAFESVGRTAETFRKEIKEKGLRQALQDLVADFKGNTTAIEAVFGNVRALAGVLGNTGAQAEAYGTVLKNITDSTDKFGAAVDRSKDTMAWTWKTVKAQAEAVAIQFGDALAPAIGKVLSKMSALLPVVESVAKAFSAMPGWVQGTVAGFLGLVAVMGPLAWGIGKIVTGVATSIEMFGKLKKAYDLAMASEKLSGMISGLGNLTRAIGASQFAMAGLAAVVVAFAAISIARLVDEFVQLQRARDGWEKDDAAERATHLQMMAEAAKKAGHEFKTMGEAQEWLRVYSAGMRGAAVETVGFTTAAKSMETQNKGLKTLTVELADAYQKGLAAALVGPKESLEQITVTLGKQAPAMKAAANGTVDLVAQYKAVREEVGRLSEAQKAEIAAGKAMGYNAGEILPRLTAFANGTKVSVGAIEQYMKQLDAAAKETKAANSPIAQLKDKIAELGNAFDAYYAQIGSAEGATAFTEWVKDNGDALIKAARDAKAFGVATTDAFDQAATAAESLSTGTALVELQKQQQAWGKEGILATQEQARQQADAVNQTVAEQLAAYVEYRAKNADLAKAGTALQIQQLEREKAATLASFRDRFKDQPAMYAMAEQEAKDYYDHLIAVASGASGTIQERMRGLGVLPKAELADLAKAAKKDYTDMVKSGSYSAEQLRAAWQRYYDLDKQARGQSTSEWMAGLDALSNAFQQLAQIGLSSIAKIVTTFGTVTSSLKMGSAGFTQFKTALSNIGKEGFSVGNIMSNMGQGILGMVSAAISGITALWNAFHKPDWKKAANDIKGAFDVNVSEDTAKKIADMAKKYKINFTQAGELNLSTVISEGGGLNPKNIQTYEKKAVELFSLIQRGGELGEKSMGSLNEVMGQFGEYAEKSGKLADSTFVAMLKRAQAEGLELANVQEYLARQSDKVSGGFNKIAKGGFASLQKAMTFLDTDMTEGIPQDLLDKQAKLQAQIADLTSKSKLSNQQQVQLQQLQAELAKVNYDIGQSKSGWDDAYKTIEEFTKDGGAKFERYGRLAVASFSAALASGKSFTQALAGIGDGLDVLRDVQSKFGLQSGNGLFTELLGVQEFAKSNAEVMEGLDGLNEMVLGLANSGWMTESTFQDLGATAAEYFTTLTNAGISGDTAMKMMGPTLQNLWQLWKENGYAVDEQTEALLRNAEEAGLVGEKHKSVNEQMLDATKRMVTVLEGVAQVFGVTIPDAADTMNRRVKTQADTMAGNIRTALGTLPTQISIPVDFPAGPMPEMPTPPPTPPYHPTPANPDYDAPPEMAEGGIVTRRTLATVGEAGTEAIVPLDRLESWLERALGAGGGASGAPVEQTIIIELDGQVIARATAKELPAFLKLHGM